MRQDKFLDLSLPLGSRRLTWRFLNELPIAGEPADVYATLENAHAALAS
jgi:haloalkane dehalogenase